MFKFLKSKLFPQISEDEPKFRCVNCGHHLKELYKTYSPTIQKLAECERCKNIADNYIEFESLVIIIDLILLSTHAQRHVLYNTSCKNLYKILMVITLLESYCLWMEIYDKKVGLSEPNRDPLYLEKGFYLSTTQIILSNFSFFMIIRLLTSCSSNEHFRNRSLTMDLFRGFMLASIAKFFFLPIIIWRDNISGISSAVHMVLIIGYFLISLIYIHSSVTGCSKKISTGTIVLAFMINKYIWFNLYFTEGIMSQHRFRLAVICLSFFFLKLSLAHQYYGTMLSEIKPSAIPPDMKWSGGEFLWGCSTTKALLKNSGKYINKNNIATRGQIYRDSVFFALPRYRKGIPATLVKTKLKRGACSVAYEPFPCWTMQEEGKCTALQSVVDLTLDGSDVLWVLDTGVIETLEENPTQVCPAKVMAFNARNGKLIKTITFEGLVSKSSRLQYLAVDYGRDGRAFIYVSDAAARAIIVYDVQASKGYRVVLPKAISEGCGKKDVLYLALTRKSCGDTTLYFTYLCSKKIFAIKTEYLRDGRNAGRIQEVGTKPGKMVIIGTDNGCSIFFRYEGHSEVYRWDTNTSFDDDFFRVVYRSESCQLSTHAVADYKHQRMRVLESNFPDYIQNKMRRFRSNYHTLSFDLTNDDYELKYTGANIESLEVVTNPKFRLYDIYQGRFAISSNNSKFDIRGIDVNNRNQFCMKNRKQIWPMESTSREVVESTTLVENLTTEKPKICGLIKKLHNISNAVDLPSQPGEFPWTVSIFRYFNDIEESYYKCSGSIISTKTILTSINCLLEDGILLRNSEIQIYLAPFLLSSKKSKIEVYDVKEILIHELNSHQLQQGLTNNIALIKIDGNIEFNDYVQPICLPEENFNIERKIGKLAGFGRSAINCPLRSGILTKAEFHIRKVDDGIFIAENTSGNSRISDLGSGLFINETNRWVLAGIMLRKSYDYVITTANEAPKEDFIFTF
ncbi:CLUMA_CG008590, isoform A, partial [Clunio marinus]